MTPLDAPVAVSVGVAVHSEEIWCCLRQGSTSVILMVTAWPDVLRLLRLVPADQYARFLITPWFVGALSLPIGTRPH